MKQKEMKQTRHYRFKVAIKRLGRLDTSVVMEVAISALQAKLAAMRYMRAMGHDLEGATVTATRMGMVRN